MLAATLKAPSSSATLAEVPPLVPPLVPPPVVPPVVPPLVADFDLRYLVPEAVREIIVTSGCYARIQR